MQKLEVQHDYAMVGSIVIPAGIYELGDKRLRGLAQYLVDNGHARYIHEANPAEPPEARGHAYPDKSLTLSELRELAREYDIDLSGVQRKDDVLQRIRGVLNDVS